MSRRSIFSRSSVSASLLTLAALAVAAPLSASATPGVVLGREPVGVPQASESSWDIPGVVIIDEKDDISARDDLDLRAKLTADFSDIRFQDTDLASQTHQIIAMLAPSEESSLLDELSHDSRIEGEEPLAWVSALFVPNDPLYPEQWNMKRVGAETAWDYATGRGVTVAVVDTGIACEDHGPFMKGTDLAQTTCVEGWNFVSNDTHANDDQGHGSHVAGTIAQSTDNAVGAVGIAFDARLMPVKVLNGQGFGTTADVADGIRFAADHGAQVINLSLGGPRNSSVLQAAVDHARSKGVVIVAAAGNSGGSVGFPGASKGVIGVSASDPNDKLAKFSSRGPEVDIAAPGVNVIQQTICNGGKDKCEQFAGFNGTSMASPHVAAAAALIESLGVSDPDAVEAALKSTARVVDDSAAGKKLYGSGILDVGAAVKAITWKHAATRLAMLVGASLLAFFMARKSNKDAASPLRPSFILGGLIAGPGLFFFAPLFLSRVSLPVDALARPLADMDLLLGASIHHLLPLANVLIPAALTVLTLHIKALRPFVGGIAAGTAAYLASTLVLGDIGGVFFSGWCALNAVACTWIARFSLSESR